ncbi:MAG: phosphoribosyltransferase [Thermoanaerobaculia bacterium]
MQRELPLKHTAEEIESRVTEIAERIRGDYRDRPLVLVSLLKGSAFFLADLSRKIKTPHGYEFINVTRRESGGNESIEIDFSTPLSISGKEVIVLKDVVNTGIIEAYLMNQLRTDGPSSIRFAAIVDKPNERRASVLVDYALFTSQDADLLVGYGMEQGGLHGHLPHIASVPAASGGAIGQ